MPEHGPDYRDVGASQHPVQRAGLTSLSFGSGPGGPVPVQPLQSAPTVDPKPTGFAAGETLDPTYIAMPTVSQRAPISSPFSPRSAPRTNSIKMI